VIRAVGEDEIIIMGWVWPEVYLSERLGGVLNLHVRALRANIFGSTGGVAGVELVAARLLSFVFFNFSP